MDELEHRVLEAEKVKMEVEMILANILLPMIITSKEKRTIMYANSYAETQYEISLSEMIGMSIDSLYTTKGQNTRLVNQMRTQGYIDNVEERFITNNGNEFVALLSVTPIYYQGEEAYIGMVTDITKQKKVEEKVKDLLNNAGQGFLYFNEDMKIGKEYSKEASRLLGENLEAKDISEILYPKYKEDKENFADNLKYILNEEDEDIQETLISLLPEEFIIENRFIQFEYKVLNQKTFMLILTDITSKKQLAQQVKDEQQALKMVVEVVTSMEQFLEIKSDYEKLTSKIDQFKNLEMINALAREIHTFKGLFAQKEMLNIVKELHNFENYIVSSKKEGVLDNIILSMSKDTMLSWIEQDILLLKDVLGKDIFENTNNISINKIRIEKVHNKVKDFYFNAKEDLNKESKLELKMIAKDIDSFANNNIKIFLSPYKKLVEQLSIRLEKQINPLVLSTEDIYLDEKYKGFLNSLVHIFRNSVDHGIESPEERFELEKPEFGTIKCYAKQNNNLLYINISDDGKGIDLDIIKNLAIKRDIYTKEDLELLEEQDILRIIFLDAFSTNEIVTDVSGRGVGLASILCELEILNGTMKIVNNPTEGIKFEFVIPMEF